MSDYTTRPPSDCPPPPKTPADQPHPPGDGTSCQDIPTTKPPALADPTPCPDTTCKCPNKPPTTTPNCLEEMIAKVTARVAAADKAKAVKTDLETFLAKAKSGSQKYTRDKYDALTKKWSDVDRDLAELARKLVCAVPCWRCVVECYVCPMLNDMHMAEARLCGDRTLYSDVHNLYDLQYWLARDKDNKDWKLARIKSVLMAWDDPATTIDKVLGDNASAIVDANKAIGTEPGKVIFDVFLRIIPKHLAVAPPSGSSWTTRIGKEYTDFCDCDTGKPDDCCGPDVGELSLRQRLLGPLPYLIDPNEYYNLICCLVKKRYEPAQDAASKADTDLSAVNDLIKRYSDQVANGLKNFATDARNAIPSIVDCCKFESDGTEPKPTQAR